MKSRYLYPAVFESDKDGINIFFPDLSGVFSCAETPEEALKNAKEALELHLYGLEQEKEPIPDPTMDYETKENERVVLVEAYMPTIRMAFETKAVQRMVSLPSWLADISKEHKINLSQTLQAALRDQLGLPVVPTKQVNQRKNAG